MARQKRAMQRFVIEFPGPLTDEADPVHAIDLQEFLEFALECARHSGCPQNTESLYYAKLDKMTVKRA